MTQYGTYRMLSSLALALVLVWNWRVAYGLKHEHRPFSVHHALLFLLSAPLVGTLLDCAGFYLAFGVDTFGSLVMGRVQGLRLEVRVGAGLPALQASEEYLPEASGGRLGRAGEGRRLKSGRGSRCGVGHIVEAEALAPAGSARTSAWIQGRPSARKASTSRPGRFRLLQLLSAGSGLRA